VRIMRVKIGSFGAESWPYNAALGIAHATVTYMPALVQWMPTTLIRPVASAP
jgi:hypothetical protein